MNKQTAAFPLAVACLLAMLLTACTGYYPQAGGAQSRSDNFVATASSSNHFEIITSDLAVRKTHNDAVRQFANDMVSAHKGLGKDMRAAVLNSMVDTAFIKDQLDASQRAQLNRLNASSGRTFDKQYVDIQKSAHSDAVRLFRGYAAHGQSPALRQFAADSLPVIEHHEQMAYNLKY